MVSKASSSDIGAPNFGREPISDEDIIRGLILALGAGGRKQKTLTIYEDSIRMLSDFARSLGLPGLATMNRTHIRHWLTSLHQKGNQTRGSKTHGWKWPIALVELLGKYDWLTRNAGGCLGHGPVVTVRWDQVTMCDA